MGGGSDSANDGTFESQRCGIEKLKKGFHERGNVGLNVVSEDFEETIKGNASGSLSVGVRDKSEDELFCFVFVLMEK